MKPLYIIERRNELALLYGHCDADSYVAGPFADLDDAEVELQRRQRRASVRRDVFIGLWVILSVFLCGLALPSAISDERVQARVEAADPTVERQRYAASESTPRLWYQDGWYCNEPCID